ncbi:MAG: Hpt domain-containing protein, partial [Planctomycetota bacterium]
MIDPDIMEAFVSESREHLATVEDDILALERGPVDVATVNHLFRSLHTVKGASGFVGLGQTKDLAHALEDVVGRVRSGELAPGSEVVDALLNGVDKLKQLIEGGEEGDLDVSDEVMALEALVEGAVRDDEPPATPDPEHVPEHVPEHDAEDEGFVVSAEDLSPESSVRISLSI